MDSDLQRSLNQLDEGLDYDEQGNQQNDSQGSGDKDSNEGSDSEPDNQHKKGKKQDVKPHQKQKRSALDQLLPPDEDVDSIPPFVVVVQGSKSSGKSSIIRSLVKHFTKHKVDQIKGTITLRSTKKQRITIIQCPNDMRAMIDLSKIADIVLLLIDASLGFEMQTFQFLSLLKCHGFPHVMGVMTHLDFYKENKQLKKAKKKFKKRFEYQVGGNNKLFTLTRWDNGLYPKLEIAKIARYIGTSNPPKIHWRLNHPYILVDRWQLSQDRNYKADDLVNADFYGYIRGSSYRMNGKIHFVGVGDYFIKQIQMIPDPCPQYKKEEEPEKKQQQNNQQSSSQNQQDGDDEEMVKKQQVVSEMIKKKKKRRTLAQNERIIYAPSCNLSTLSFEHTSGYVTIPHEYVKFTRKENPEEGQQQEIEEGVQMVRNLQDIKQTINEKLRKRDRDIELFEGVKLEDSEQEENQNNKTSKSQFEKKRKQLLKMKERTQNMLIPDNEVEEANRKQNLSYLIYQSKQTLATFDCSKFHPLPEPIEHETFKSLFVTGMQSDALNQMQDSEEQQQQKKKKEIEKILKQNVKKAKINENTNFFQKGYYVRVVIQNMKYSDFQQINTGMPIILSRINLGEDNLGFVKVNFKRHRWYLNLLKTNDPIIVSSGWRRYQTLITFAKVDANDRLRFLKYTPHYDFCVGVFYGNFNQQNSGCVFTQTINNSIKKFRIAGSGLIMEMNKSFQIMKKIKLIGEPYKIMKNTAFIKGMFNSTLQVANYIGAQVRTVSGIRGQIKKGTKQGGQGTFRATFEDKILMSDIVFCKAWYRVYLQRFYNPILNFGKNRLMKTKYELRIEKDIDIQMKPDSQYRNVDRAPQTFKPLLVPKKLQGKLPFKTMQKVKQSKKDRIKRKQEQGIPKVLMSDKDREVASLIQRLNTIRNQKQQLKQEKFKQKMRIREAMQRPKQQYYEKLKKDQKSEKMASLMRKRNKEERQSQRKFSPKN